MKFLLPLSIAFFLAACVTTPQDKQADHQRELWKEAHDNFLALKEQEHPRAQQAPPPPTPNPFLKTRAVAAAQPTPAPHSRIAAQPKAVAQLAPPAKVRATPRPRTRVAQNNDDTVYYWQMQSAQRTTTPREQAAELKYARKLAKSPEDLTPEERLWAHEHY